MHCFKLKTLKIILFFAGMLSVFYANAQQKTLYYNILNKDEIIGKMIFSQSKADDELSLKITSDVLSKMIVNTKIHVEEWSRFQNGKLVYSMFKKLINDKEKANHETKASGDDYYLNSDGKKNILNNLEIGYNTMMLYYREPSNISELYSENFQQMVKIKEVDKHTYKILLPDGNYNTYYYNNNVCTKVDIHNGLFNVQMVLKK